MKTFKIKNAKSGELIDAEQLATFAGYVQNVQFRFVVTRLHSLGDVALTHRASTMRVAVVTPSMIQAALGDYAAAGRLALDLLVQSKGAARVAAALRAAED